MTLFMFFAPAGYHKGAWRRQDSAVELLYGPSLPHEIALQAERAKIHALLFADWLSFEATGENPDLTGFEPLTTMASVSAVTTSIGLVGTASTTFWEPFHLARMFSQIDFLSMGRAGWNIVTSSTGAENFGTPLPPHDERYRRADEYLAAVEALWTAWAPNAVLNDRLAGVWADRTRITWPCHIGDHYQVEGPLLVPRSPQVRPLLCQAGGSEAGRTFAAKYAEVIYCVAHNIREAADYRRDIRDRAVKFGRNPDSVKVLPGLMPIMAETEASAREFEIELKSLVQFESGIAILSQLLDGIDLSNISEDEPIPVKLLAPPSEVQKRGGPSRYEYFFELAIRDRLKLRALVELASRAEGHNVVVGDYLRVAGLMKEWFEAGACDGFILLPTAVPVGVASICQGLVPTLQELGVFQAEYSGGTLRESINP